MNERANMMENSNEIRPPRTPASAGGIGVRGPHTLHNKNLTNVCKKLRNESEKAYLFIEWHKEFRKHLPKNFKIKFS